MLEATLGEHVPIRITVTETTADSRDGDKFHPIGATVTITKPDGTTDVSNGSPVYVGTGTFLYHYDTTSLTTTGDYEVSVKVTTNVDGVTVRHDDILRLKPSGANQ